MQKFNKGDHVMIAKDLGFAMSHFTSDCEAIVLYSYAEEYGGNNTGSYALHIKGKGQSAWYEENQLTLIKANQHDLLKQWKTEKKSEDKLKTDLDWIFAHGDEVLISASGSTVAALAECFGLTNLWGSTGEGFVYYSNAKFTLKLAQPFLKSGDKTGWLEFCETVEQS